MRRPRVHSALQDHPSAAGAIGDSPRRKPFLPPTGIVQWGPRPGKDGGFRPWARPARAGRLSGVRSKSDLIGRDPGLQARMLIPLSLLALLYVVLGVVIIAAGGGLA